MEPFLAFSSSVLHYAIPFLVVLGIVVFVHEFGHFWIARLSGVRVESFSIGFGHELWGREDKRGTRWKVAWLPLGGYVKMFGDSDPSSARPDEKVKTMTEDEKKVAFYHQPVGKRFAIVAAGPAANYIFAILVLALLFLFNGQPYTPPVVNEVQENSAAMKAGIVPGDRVLSIGGETTDSFEDIKRVIMLNTGTPVDIALERGGARKVIRATPEVVPMTDRFGGEHKMARLGIVSEGMEFRSLSVPAALQQAVMESWNLTATTLEAVWQMIMGVRNADGLSGPLRIAEMSGKIAQEGTAAFVLFLAHISVSLGLVNLFPIPLLDGSHLVFYAAEKVRSRPLGDRAQEIGAWIGLFLVAMLMLFATWNDLVHLRVVSYIYGLFS